MASVFKKIFSLTDAQFKRIESIIKYLVMIIAAIWTLTIGTDWIEKQAAEVKLAKSKYELEAARLGKDGLYPKASTLLNFNQGTKLWGSDNNLCTISGLYTIENIGGVPLTIDSIQFDVYEILPIRESELSDENVVSFSLSPKLQSLQPIFSEAMSVKENITTSNLLQRAFGYVIKVNPNALYAIKASAQGGIPGLAELNALSLTSFSENDLTHVSASKIICPDTRL
ncbi:hypothetical protein [Aliiglaciecola litoralis]|uniref:Uncharacterized protein n=1 Tax=Aliiglaciecola litoralis TaxID=582857 RepID=A0ABN1LCK4_9ALTE